MNRIFLPALLLSLTLVSGCSDTKNDGPLIPLQQRYLLSSPDSVPEGVAFDPVERVFYATSLQGGSITRVDADGTETVFRPADNRARLVGTKVDADNRRLWVCAQGVDGLDNRVWVYDLASAAMVLEFFLGALSTEGSCNDLVLDETGIAFVTDPANPYIYRLDPISGDGTILATNPLFNDVIGQGLGLNGISLTADGSALIVAHFWNGQLLRVDLPNADNITALVLSGNALLPPDGLAELNGDIYAVSNAVVSRIQLNGDATAGEVTVVPQISGLSTATVAEGALYVIKSEVSNFVIGGTLDTPFEIFQVDLDAFNQ